MRRHTRGPLSHDGARGDQGDPSAPSAEQTTHPPFNCFTFCVFRFGSQHRTMSDEAGSSTPLVQSKLARARAGRGSMLGPTPAAKKLAKPVPFGGVQTLPRRSPDASRSLIQATSRLSRNPTSPTSRQVQLSPKTEARRKTTAAGRYSEASQRSMQLFRPPKQLPGAGRTTVSVGGAQLKVGDPVWVREEDRASAEAPTARSISGASFGCVMTL